MQVTGEKDLAFVGREIGRWFLWAAAFLLCLEMILAARMRMPDAGAAPA